MTAGIARAEELKRRYLTEAIMTASPATRVTMLFDHMVLDLRRADEGFASGDWKVVNDSLCHVQEILVALQATLRTDLWEGAARVGSLYAFLCNELVLANINKDRAQAARAAISIAELGEAWHGAAQAVVSAHPVLGDVVSGVA